MSIPDVRLLKEFNDHEMIIELTRSATNLQGFISIHNTNLGPALGGTRMRVYASEDEALKDVLNLSNAMSYKCALAGLPFGGGKGVIVLPEKEKYDRDKLLASYAQMVEKLRGLFKTGTDVGVTENDVKKMARYTSHMLGVSVADRGTLTTGGVAALGVYYAIKAALQHTKGTDDMKGVVIGIKGLGKLGSELLRLVHNDGAQVIAADINTARNDEIAQQYADVKIVSHKTIHAEAMDIYAPCALGAEFDDITIERLQARMIVGGANNQLADPTIGDKLFERGILYAPDYIANAGGLIYVADELEPDGFKKERVLHRTEGIKDTLLSIFDRAKANNLATHRVADAIALERIEDGRD